MKAQRIADLYSDYLLASFGATTATGLSELLEGEVSHDQVTRYLAGTKKTASDLWRTVKSFVREVQAEAGVLILDDSIEEKPYTDENDIVCWHGCGSHPEREKRYGRESNSAEQLRMGQSHGIEGVAEDPTMEDAPRCRSCSKCPRDSRQLVKR